MKKLIIAAMLTLATVNANAATNCTEAEAEAHELYNRMGSIHVPYVDNGKWSADHYNKVSMDLVRNNQRMRRITADYRFLLDSYYRMECPPMDIIGQLIDRSYNINGDLGDAAELIALKILNGQVSYY